MAFRENLNFAMCLSDARAGNEVVVQCNPAGLTTWICGSKKRDCRSIKPLPRTPGGEVAGRIVAVGAEVKALASR